MAQGVLCHSKLWVIIKQYNVVEYEPGMGMEEHKSMSVKIARAVLNIP